MQIIIIHCKFALLELCQHVVQISALGASFLYTSNNILLAFYYFCCKFAWKNIVSKTMNKYCHSYWYGERKYLNFCWVFIPITHFSIFFSKGNPPENVEKLNNRTHCLSLCCWNRSPIGNTELSGKRYYWGTSGDLYSKPCGYYFTSIAKMAFDIMKKTQRSAMLGNWASQLVHLSVLHCSCGLLGVITCMPTHTLCLQTPPPRYNGIL